MPGYLTRLVDPFLSELLEHHPAVLLVGPRACGKTTTARKHCLGRLRLDRPAEAAVARIDPDAALSEGPFPLLIDEWQVVPEVLGAVKRAVDDAPAPGRFVVTGSTQADLTAVGWPATGRLIRLPMYGFTEGELEQAQPGARFLRSLLTRDTTSFPTPPEAQDVRGYMARALRGSFPEAALADSDRVRQRWLASYIDQVVSRDASLVGSVRDPMRLRRYLQVLASSTAGTPTTKTLIDAAGIERGTVNAYDSLLEQLMITDRLPAWSSNRLNRLIRLPKRHLVDPAFAGPLLGVDLRVVMRDGDLLGRLLESFVVAQLRAECATFDSPPRLFHIRDANGRHEVDVIVEFSDGQVIGIEVKADAAPGPEDARHLRWLRDSIGARFAAGAVLHTGPRSLRIDDSILALPICSLWT
jgi:uncharacterized protein